MILSPLNFKTNATFLRHVPEKTEKGSFPTAQIRRLLHQPHHGEVLPLKLDDFRGNPQKNRPTPRHQVGPEPLKNRRAALQTSKEVLQNPSLLQPHKHPQVLSMGSPRARKIRREPISAFDQLFRADPDFAAFSVHEYEIGVAKAALSRKRDAAVVLENLSSEVGV
jgi:hypothetical protein